jgi:hypothetical protein
LPKPRRPSSWFTKPASARLGAAHARQAALLTLVGYSVNDKVVVYDRMRENLRSLRKRPSGRCAR